jgi:hypothetical protein
MSIRGPFIRHIFEMNELLATENPFMKSAFIQVPATILEPARGPSATRYCSFSGMGRLFERIRVDHCWHSLVRSIRAILRGSLDSSAYQQFSLSREISIVFTSQGPLLYRGSARNTAHSTTQRSNR